VTWAGLWKPQYGQIIPAEWVWGVVDSLDILYAYHNELRSEVNAMYQTLESKLDITNYYLSSIDTTTKEIKLEVKKIEQKLDLTIYYLSDIDSKLSSIEVKLDDVKSKLDVQNEYLRLIAPARGILTITKTVTPTPAPLFIDELQVRRIIVKVPVDALYLVYIGDANTQEFVIDKGEKLELFVKDPRTVYVKSTGDQAIFLLFELAQ